MGRLRGCRGGGKPQQERVPGSPGPGGEQAAVVGLGAPPQPGTAVALGAGGGFCMLWGIYQGQPHASGAPDLSCKLEQGI